MKQWLRLTITFLIILLAVYIKEKPQLWIPSEEGNITIYFCPEDDCEKILFEQIENSNKTHCAFYDLDYYLDAEIILHEDMHYKGSKLMHNKFCIFDDKRILTGSMNPTERGTKYNNNNLIIIESKILAKNYEKEFQELKEGKQEKTRITKLKINGILIENYFCPEDNCEERVFETLQKGKEIQFMTFTFTSNKIGNLLLTKDQEGIFETRQLSDYSQYFILGGIIDTNPYTMHHKVFIIDKETVILGSYNPTKNANENNDENILIIHDKEIAKKFVQEFNTLKWQFLL